MSAPTALAAALPPALTARLLGLPRALRRAGLPVSLNQVLGFVRALDQIDISRRKQLFDAGQALLISRREHRAIYADVFARFFAVGAAREAPSHRDEPRGEARQVVGLAVDGRDDGGAAELVVPDRRATASQLEILRGKSFADLDADELETVRRLIGDLRWRLAERRSRRRVTGRGGSQLDVRRALRQAARLGGAVPQPPRRRRKVQRRPLVLLADVSGSMERISRVVLQLFYALVSGRADVECFVFGTRLTRITSELRLRDPDRALAAATRRAVDFAGGTRIGTCLAHFNRRWSRRVLRRGAVVLVISDGWERDDPCRLAAELARLRRSSHRLIWLNPLMGQPGYQPLVAGMAAALPELDDFLPIHDLRSLESLAQHLRDLPRRRGARPTHRRAAR